MADPEVPPILSYIESNVDQVHKRFIVKSKTESEMILGVSALAISDEMLTRSRSESQIEFGKDQALDEIAEQFPKKSRTDLDINFKIEVLVGTSAKNDLERTVTVASLPGVITEVKIDLEKEDVEPSIKSVVDQIDRKPKTESAIVLKRDEDGTSPVESQIGVVIGADQDLHKKVMEPPPQSDTQSSVPTKLKEWFVKESTTSKIKPDIDQKSVKAAIATTDDVMLKIDLDESQKEPQRDLDTKVIKIETVDSDTELFIKTVAESGTLLGVITGTESTILPESDVDEIKPVIEPKAVGLGKKHLVKAKTESDIVQKKDLVKSDILNYDFNQVSVEATKLLVEAKTDSNLRETETVTHRNFDIDKIPTKSLIKPKVHSGIELSEPVSRSKAKTKFDTAGEAIPSPSTEVVEQRAEPETAPTEEHVDVPEAETPPAKKSKPPPASEAKDLQRTRRCVVDPNATLKDVAENPNYLTSLPVIPEDSTPYKPMLYTFRVKAKGRASKLENLTTKAPPLYLLFDHAIAVVWTLFNKESDRRKLGVVQLQWALHFLETIYNAEGVHPGDVQLCIDTITNYLIDHYAAMSHHKPIYGEAKFGDYVKDDEKKMPFSVNYAEMIDKCPDSVPEVETATPVNNKMLEELENVKEVVGIKSIDLSQVKSKEKVMSILNDWKKEQIEKIEEELKLLYVVEDMMKNSDLQGFAGYTDENQFKKIFRQNKT